MAKQKCKGSVAQKKSKGGKKSSAPPPNSNSSKTNGNNANNGNGKNNKSRQRKQHHQQQQDNDDDDAQFRNTLLNQGNTIKEMNADGNCLFRSLSDQLYHDTGSKHDIVRHDVCNFLSKNKEEFQHFLLMGDDDEDVLDIDEYIERMREDGEWGGNVEMVVASRVYRRSIKVYSGEYSNGVLSIVCHDKETGKDAAGEEHDLLLAYHGNDHYNSIHPVGGIKKQSTTKSSTSRDPAAASAKSKKKGKASSVKEDENAIEKEHHHSHNNEATSKMKLHVETAQGNKTRSRPPTRGSNCPCGSGLKYKKCCMAQEKSNKRLANHLEKSGVDAGSADNPTDEKKEDEFIGDFRVLTI